jgi:hypothetical protein
MNTLLLFILLMLGLSHFGLPPKVNQVIAIVLAVIAIVLFVVWPEGFHVRAGNP